MSVIWPETAEQEEKEVPRRVHSVENTNEYFIDTVYTVESFTQVKDKKNAVCN